MQETQRKKFIPRALDATNARGDKRVDGHQVVTALVADAESIISMNMHKLFSW
jgi:hypothetical protein